MDQNTFDDLFSFEDWLLAGSEATACRLASRASLFVLPVIFDSDRFWFADVFGAWALGVLRAHLTIPLTLDTKIPSQPLWDTASGLGKGIPLELGIQTRQRGRLSTPATTERAFGATVFAVESVNLTKGDQSFKASHRAAMKVIDAVCDERFFDDLDSITWSAIESDANAIDDGYDPFTMPLWPETPPDWFATAEAAMRTYWQTNNPSHWAFWQRWWDAAIAGRPLDWQLQHDIALIPDAIWQSGPGPVAEAIERIEDAHRNRELSALTNPTAQESPAPAQRAVQTKLIAAQINVLNDLVAAELEFLRGHNGWSLDDLPKVEAQRKALEAIRDLVAKMLSALEGDLPVSTALTVINQNLPAIVENAEELEKKANQPQVSAEIYAIAAAVKILTESGVPGDVAAKIAYAEEARGFFKKLFRGWT